MKRSRPQLKIRLDHDVKAWLEKKAKHDERTQNWLINRVLKEAMEREACTQ